MTFDYDNFMGLYLWSSINNLWYHPNTHYRILLTGSASFACYFFIPDSLSQHTPFSYFVCLFLDLKLLLFSSFGLFCIISNIDWLIPYLKDDRACLDTQKFMVNGTSKYALKLETDRAGSIKKCEIHLR